MVLFSNIYFSNYSVCKGNKSIHFYSHSTSECDYSDHPVSVVVVVLVVVIVVIGVNFFGFLTSSLEPLHGFASNFVWMFLGWISTKFVKIGVLPLFFME